MRVILFTGSFLPQVGGMEYVVHYLAEALFDAGVDVTVVAKRQPQPDNFAHRYPLVRYGLPFRGGHRTRVDHLSARYELARLCARKPADVANIHSVSVVPLCLGFFKGKGIPVAMTPHGEDVQRVPEIGYGRRLNPRWDRSVRKYLDAADAITVISGSIRRELDWVDPDKIIDIPNGIHTRVFGRARSTNLQEALGLPPDAGIILSVGRNHVKKGYEYGIRAAAELFGDHKLDNWYYVLIGRGVSSLAPLVGELSLEARVFLVENVSHDRLKQCYNSSRIFFSPSIVEGLSLVSIEAMACGLPLVVTDVPGNEDVVTENGCGLIVRSRDIADMARGLRELISDDERRASLAETALTRSAAYDWEVIAKRYLAAYERILGKRGRRAA